MKHIVELLKSTPSINKKNALSRKVAIISNKKIYKRNPKHKKNQYE